MSVQSSSRNENEPGNEAAPVDSAASIPRELDDDGQLVRAACDGNAQAFDQLVQRHAGRLLRMVRNLTSSREDAEDVIQEAFASAYFKLDSFAGRASFFTWLYRIALNKAISRRRKRRIETAMKAQNLDDTQPSDSERASPEMVVEQAEQVNRLREAIARLEPDRQSVLVLRDVDGKDYSEIAEILNVPVGTVRSRLHRARCDLKQILEADASPLRGGLRS